VIPASPRIAAFGATPVPSRQASGIVQDLGKNPQDYTTKWVSGLDGQMHNGHYEIVNVETGADVIVGRISNDGTAVEFYDVSRGQPGTLIAKVTTPRSKMRGGGVQEDLFVAAEQLSLRDKIKNLFASMDINLDIYVNVQTGAVRMGGLWVPQNTQWSQSPYRWSVDSNGFVWDATMQSTSEQRVIFAAEKSTYNTGGAGANPYGATSRVADGERAQENLRPSYQKPSTASPVGGAPGGRGFSQKVTQQQQYYKRQ